jgi:hypothetical protein
MGCPAQVYASVDKDLEKVVVYKVLENHCHPIGTTFVLVFIFLLLL